MRLVLTATGPDGRTGRAGATRTAARGAGLLQQRPGALHRQVEGDGELPRSAQSKATATVQARAAQSPPAPAPVAVTRPGGRRGGCRLVAVRGGRPRARRRGDGGGHAVRPPPHPVRQNDSIDLGLLRAAGASSRTGTDAPTSRRRGSRIASPGAGRAASRQRMARSAARSSSLGSQVPAAALAAHLLGRGGAGDHRGHRGLGGQPADGHLEHAQTPLGRVRLDRLDGVPVGGGEPLGVPAAAGEPAAGRRRPRRAGTCR